MFVSRHIYILAAALVHLGLGAYVSPLAGRGARGVQWLGSILLLASCVLLIAAFVFEPVAGRTRTNVSTWGLYTLFAGVVLHFLAASVRGAGIREPRR
jgi:hypothetical protein